MAPSFFNSAKALSTSFLVLSFPSHVVLLAVNPFLDHINTFIISLMHLLYSPVHGPDDDSLPASADRPTVVRPCP